MKKKKNLTPVLESRKVLNNQFSVVLTKEGYYLQSEEKFLELKTDTSVPKVGRILLDESAKSSEKHFLVVHQFDYHHKNIGILEFDEAGPRFVAC